MYSVSVHSISPALLRQASYGTIKIGTYNSLKRLFVSHPEGELTFNRSLILPNLLPGPFLFNNQTVYKLTSSAVSAGAFSLGNLFPHS